MNRREFIQAALVAMEGAGVLGAQLYGLEPVSIANPLGTYPDRNWEQLYRDQYRVDGSFAWVCAPNDTHNCRMRAFLRNGVVIRSEQAYEGGTCKDLYGNTDTVHWNPRGCAKGFTQQRRVYGPYRLREPLVRKGWKQWADDGFPSLSDKPELRDKYKFNSRGTDTFVKVSWDEIYRYHAQAVLAISRTYSGEDGAKRLAADGYEHEMIEACHGAGTRTCKLRGGMGLLGVIGKYGLYRWSNMLALVDEAVRKVPPKEALGGRLWSNYTWHGDQAPGHPYVHGLQAADCDFNDMRHAKLHIQCGKNLVENKMPDSHWFIEMMERGGRIVVITPEYSPPATKADYWIQVRPGCTDTALMLGVTKLMMDRDWYDDKFVRAYTGRAVVSRPTPDRRTVRQDRRFLRVGRKTEDGPRDHARPARPAHGTGWHFPGTLLPRPRQAG
jgi:nitrate reductase alpha subunit